MPNIDALMLRPFKAQDEQLLVEYLNDPQVTHYLSSRIPFPYKAEDAQWWINKGSRNGFIRAITVNGKLAGCVGAEVGQHEYQHCAEVGYWLAKDFWGNGFATQALTLLVDELKQITQIVRLQASVYEGNQSSAKVLEKCGFVQQGYFPKAIYKNDRFYHEVVYGRTIA